MARGRAKYAVRASDHFVPANQCLFGADDPDQGRQFTGAAGIETQLGKTMGVRNRHYSWNAAVPHIAATWKSDAAAHAIPMVSLGGQGYTAALVKEIAAGAHDAYWLGLFHALAATGQPGIFRPWMEMNGSHNAYSADSKAFVSMWKHVWGLAHGVTGASLTWIFCPQAADPKQVWPNYWPGKAYVDWMGIDLYRHPWSFAAPWQAWAMKQTLPFCVCESGFEQNAVVHDPARANLALDKDASKTGHSLIEDTRLAVKANRNTVMYLVWNSIGPVGNDHIDTSRASLAQYRNFTGDVYFRFGS